MKTVTLILLIIINFFSFSMFPQKKYSLNEVMAQRPNILFISVDDLNDWEGFLKEFPGIKTSNIDKLASQGVVFNNAHCQAPICAPSRLSVFSGLYPHTTGLYYQFNDIDLKEKNEALEKTKYLPDYLEDFGYNTLAVGKVFHDGDGIKVFQEYGGIFPEIKYGPFLKNRERKNYDPEWFPEKRKGTITDWATIDLPDSSMVDFKIANWAIEKLSQEHNRPFFMAVGFVRPHVPWYVPEKWYEMVKKDVTDLPPYNPDDFKDIPEISKKLHEISAMPDTKWLIETGKWKEMVTYYLASVAFVDNQIGRVLNTLEKSPYNKNTLVILWSDHGYHLGEKGRVAKHSLWERSTHVPLIISGQNLKKGKLVNKQVQLLDLYPTILDLAGLPPNENNEGHSLRPLLYDNQLKWSNPAITSYGYKNTSVIKDDFHLIQYRDGTGELYDLKNDPNEWKNLYNDKKYNNILLELNRCLPKVYAPLSKVNYLNVNDYIDAELKEFKVLKSQ